jgi:hypothetical protein
VRTIRAAVEVSIRRGSVIHVLGPMKEGSVLASSNASGEVVIKTRHETDKGAAYITLDAASATELITQIAQALKLNVTVS